MMPKSALGFIGFTVWAIFFSRSSYKTAKNPILLKGKKISSYTSSSEIGKENVGFAKLPDNPKGFISWEKNTYQANVFDTPENVNQSNMRAFLPRNVTKGRILPWGMRRPFEMFFKSAPKSLISAAQYIVNGDTAEILFMSTRQGWKKLGIMSALVDAIKEEHNVKNIIYWELTEAGKKFAKKKRTK